MGAVAFLDIQRKSWNIRWLWQSSHLFFAELDSVGAPQIGEGVAAIEQFTVEEFEALLRRGDIGDSFTVAAYTHARLRRLI